MVKLPRPGRVKTRLARDIGAVAATWWFRHQVARVLRRLRDPRWRLVLAVAPDREGLSARTWPRDLARVPQGPGDLGVRMLRAVRAVAPADVLVVGADIPSLDRDGVAEGFAALGRHDAVIGPASDGGYWMVGFARGRRLAPGVFAGVRWSGPHARADTLATMDGMRVATVRCLDDVDSAADLSAASGSRRRRRRSSR